MKAIFQINNVLDAVPSYPVKATFTQRGGLIGAGDDSTWQIQSAGNAIEDSVARIVVMDGQFTIESLSKTPIRINGAKAKIPKGRPVILSDKDVVKFGDLECNVRVSLSETLTTASTEPTVSVSSLVGGDQEKRESLIVEGNVIHQERVRPQGEQEIMDPLNALDTQMKKDVSVDPLSAFKTLDAPTDTLVKHAQSEAQKVGTAPDHSDMHFASMPPVNVKRDTYGFEDFDGPEPTAVDAVSLEVSTPVDHIALRPLARRLGISLGDMTTEQADRTLGDIGASLREAISGLTRIYKERPKGEGNFPIATMHMHALEDNPLRFSQDADTALHALFSKRGPVHLSAPSAVAESMAHLHAHQRATEHSVDAALDTVLKSLRPQALERRFTSYDHDDIPEDKEAYEAWCWRMYKAYFSELRSQRQKGLQMLFWEIFEHEYNAQMRRSQFGADFDLEDE